MSQIRAIRPEEITLTQHLIRLAGKDPEAYVMPDEVEEYEGGVMGSINFTLGDAGDYGGDLVQVEYYDEDSVRVLITLTHNSLGEILDMDFWKENFSRLIRYPTPQQVTINTRGI